MLLRLLNDISGEIWSTRNGADLSLRKPKKQERTYREKEESSKLYALKLKWLSTLCMGGNDKNNSNAEIVMRVIDKLDQWGQTENSNEFELQCSAACLSTTTSWEQTRGSWLCRHRDRPIISSWFLDSGFENCGHASLFQANDRKAEVSHWNNHH